MMRRLALTWLVLVDAASVVRAEETRGKDNPFAEYTVDVEPQAVADDWFVPFDTSDRKRMATLLMVSEFGAPRLSYVKGHMHTGTDMAPKPAQDGAKVLAVANGVVCSIHLDHPHKTVVVKQRLENGETLYTSYKHLESIVVEPGQQVNPNTVMGRLYTARETRQQGGAYDHLHLEIRKDFDDHGMASWTTMTRADLDAHFHDPWKYLRRQVERPRLLVINPAVDAADLSLVGPLVTAISAIRPVNVVVRHYKEVNTQTVQSIRPSGLVVAGQTTPWSQYPAEDLADVEAVLRSAQVPVLGICGGHQLLALAFGAGVDFTRAEEKGSTYERCTSAAGAVQTRRTSSAAARTEPMLKGLGDRPRFWAYHCEEVKALPKGFVLLLSGHAEGSSIQMMRHATRPLYGVQFHPEQTVEGETSGARLLGNFVEALKPAVTTPQPPPPR